MNHQSTIANEVLRLVGRSNGKHPGNTNQEKVSDLLDRLRSYDEASQSYKLDRLSIPEAIRMVLRIFPHKYCKDNLMKEKILRAFVSTIIPGSDQNEESLVRMYVDDYYPFHTYCGYFVFDLNKRSRKLFAKREFVSLTFDERTQVVQNALNGRELTRRLYKGAILMAQVSYYGAVYDEERGCPLIDFPGRNEGYSREETTYSFSSIFFDRELSFDGHPW
jgi:hypothetical protein